MPPYVDNAVSTLVAFLSSLIAAVLLLIVGHPHRRIAPSGQWPDLPQLAGIAWHPDDGAGAPAAGVT